MQTLFCGAYVWYSPSTVWYSPSCSLGNVWWQKCDTLPPPAHCVVFRCGTLRPAGLQTQDLWQGGAVNHTLFLRAGIFSVVAAFLTEMCSPALCTVPYNGFQQPVCCVLCSGRVLPCCAVLCIPWVYFVYTLCISCAYCVCSLCVACDCCV